MHRVDDRNFLNRLSDQRLRKSTQIRQCEAASSRGQLKRLALHGLKERPCARPRRHAAN